MTASPESGGTSGISLYRAGCPPGSFPPALCRFCGGWDEGVSLHPLPGRPLRHSSTTGLPAWRLRFWPTCPYPWPLLDRWAGVRRRHSGPTACGLVTPGGSRGTLGAGMGSKVFVKVSHRVESPWPLSPQCYSFVQKRPLPWACPSEPGRNHHSSCSLVGIGGQALQ